MKLKKLFLNINNVDRILVFDPEKDTLAAVIRRLGLTGTKIGCGTGHCGACSVILNGQVVRSCSLKMSSIEDYSTILTIEGIGAPHALHPIQQAFVTYGAVQCGFCSPGFIVSTYALLAKNSRPTRGQVRGWFRKHSNVCRCTGYKPIVDAVMHAAEVMRGEKSIGDITFKDPENGEYYGSDMPRPSGIPKATGLYDYGDDFALKMPDGTLHLAIVQPRITHHANILSIDTSEAEKMPGVVKVITAGDVIGTNSFAVRRSMNPHNTSQYDHEIICSKKIMRYGDVVALVAADTQDHAREAAKHVRVEIEQLPEYLNYLDAVAPGAAPIHLQDGTNQLSKQPLFKGDARNIKSIIENSAFSVTSSYHTTREPHLPIEGDIIQAYWDIDDMLTIHSKALALYMVASMISSGIGVPHEKIRMIRNPSGGSFGWTLSPVSYALAAVAAIATGMPVSLSMSYEEFMHHSGKRAPSYSNASLGCDENGIITGLQYDLAFDAGPYPIVAERLLVKTATLFGCPYNIPNIAGLGRLAVTNHNYNTAYRCVGAPQIHMAAEQTVDMLALKAGMDPLEFRYLNAAEIGDAAPGGLPYREVSAKQLVDKLRPLYIAATYKAKAEDTPQKRRGVGVAFGTYTCSGAMDYAGCKLELNPDDSISIFNTWVDVGQGGDAAAVMMVLEALKPLGLKPSQLKLRNNDTKTSPNSGSTSASRSLIMNGLAAIETANVMLTARDKGGGQYRSYDEMKEEGLDTIFEASFLMDGSGEGFRPLSPDTGQGDAFPTHMYSLYMVEVEVNNDTGETSILKGTIVCDVGRVANRVAVLGNAYGSFANAVGHALSENYDDVEKHNTLAGAGIPTIDMIPDDIDVLIIENPRGPMTPFGSAGCGEAFQTGCTAAVLNAIYNACGVRIFDLPALPEKVKAGLDIIAAGGSIEPPGPYFLGSDFYETIENLMANPIS